MKKDVTKHPFFIKIKILKNRKKLLTSREGRDILI